MRVGVSRRRSRTEEKGADQSGKDERSGPLTACRSVTTIDRPTCFD